jgi:gluconolactonase
MEEQIKLEIYNEKLLDIIKPGQKLRKIAGGFQFTEGPIWHNAEQHLTFSDIPASRIYRWHRERGVEIVCENARKPNGNAYDLQGRIITCEHAASRLTRRNADGTGEEVLASHYNNLELNSPNDVVVKSDGSIYFTDPRFGRRDSPVGVPREQQLSFQGVFRLEPETGELIVVADDFENPNGLCFSPDEKKLYVNDSPRSHIRVFDVKADGTLENGRQWAVTAGDGPGVPDGMKIDTAGNLYCCAQGGIHFFDENAACLGVLRMPEQTANFTWGDEDLRTLYITASATVYSVRVEIPGVKNYT